MPALLAMSHFDLDNQLVLKIIAVYTCMMIKMGKQVVFCIPRNEKAGLAAKCGLNKLVINIKILPTDLYPTIDELCKSEWQQSWDNCVSNKLLAVKPRLYAP